MRAAAPRVALLLATLGCQGAVGVPGLAPAGGADGRGPVPDGGGERPPVDLPDAGPPPADGSSPDVGPAPPPVADGGPPSSVIGVFDLGVLHRIEISVDSAYLGPLDMDEEHRVPCTVVYDGTTLASSGIRKKGGMGSLRPLAGKPAFSIKFNELVKGQKLAGLSKLLLDNAVQDPSFLDEHTAYEIARREGLAAPLTAHGIVTFNGQPYGLYVVREAINDDFLKRTYGKGNEGGNLYEGGMLGNDFLASPETMDLKNEVEEMRSRDDMKAVARLADQTPDDRWAAALASKVDLPGFLHAAALEWLVGQWDGYFFNANNYYLYHHPVSDRFVYIVVGMDFVLENNLKTWGLGSSMMRKIDQLPELKAPYQARMADIIRNLDVAAIQARMDQVARIIHTYKPTDRRTRDDFSSFDQQLPRKKAAIAIIKTRGILPDDASTLDAPRL